MHYLLSDKRNADDDFHKSEIIGSEFCAKFSESSSDFVICKKSGVKTDELTKDGKTLTSKNLRKELSLRWFGLSEEESAPTYAPKFGALLAYFIRKERSGGFASPVLNSTSQQGWDSQVSLSYLLGFDWRLPQQLQIKKDQKKDADTLAKMIKGGYLNDHPLAHEAASGNIRRAILAMKNEQELRETLPTRANRFVARWQQLEESSQLSYQRGDMSDYKAARNSMAGMAKSLERDPQLESLLANRKRELGIDITNGRSLGRELAFSHGLDLGRGRGLEM